MWSPRVAVLSLLLSCVSSTPSTSSEEEPFNWSLIPAFNHSLDALHLRHLQPSHSIELAFQAKENLDAFASSAQQQLFRTVALENSAYVQHVKCQDDEIEITFDSIDAATTAWKWPTKDFVLITHHDTCNAANERGVYMVDGAWRFNPDYPLRVKATVEKTTFEHVTNTLEVTYGVNSDAKETAPKRRATSCSVARKHRRACGPLICKRQGVVLSPDVLWRFNAYGDNEENCAKACMADAKCLSFSFNEKTSYCVGFGKNVKAMEFSRTASDLLFYDQDCWEAIGDCGIASSAPVPSRSGSGHDEAPLSAKGYSRGLSPSLSNSKDRNTYGYHSASPASSIYQRSSYSTRSAGTSPSALSGSHASSSRSSSLPTAASTSSRTSMSFPSLVWTNSSSTSLIGSTVSPLSSSSSSNSAGHSSSSFETSSSSFSFPTSSSSLSSFSDISIISVSSSTGSSSLSLSSSDLMSTASLSSTSSATISAPSGVHTLNEPELYLFSLFALGPQGIVTLPDGNVLADLGAKGNLTPTIGTEDLAPFDIEYQTRLRQIGIDAGLPSDEDCARQAAAGLDAAGSTRFTSLPSSINETLPEDLELSPQQPFTKRSVTTTKNTELAVYNSAVAHSLEKRNWIVDSLIDTIIDTFVDPVLEAICKTCHDVYEFYKHITDPLWVIGQLCEPCRPALDFAEPITDPFGYAKEVLSWYLTYGAYDPQGVNHPPPLPPPPPPPIEASAVLDTSFIVDSSNMPMINPMLMPDRLTCIDCRVIVPRITVWGSVAVNIQKSRIEKALFRVDMTAHTSSTIQMVGGSARRWSGSIGVGTKYLGTIADSQLFSFSVSYTNLLIYDLSSSSNHDITFGVSASTIGASAIMDLGFRRIDSQSGWSSVYDVEYPSLGFAADFDGSLTNQGIVTVDINVLGSLYKERAITTSTSLGMRTRVIAPDDESAGTNGVCGTRETQVDAWVGGETKLALQPVYNFNQPLGRRCFKLKSYAETKGAPPQPYCGNSTMASGPFTWNGQDYIMHCSTNVVSAKPVMVSLPQIRTFDACLDECNKRRDCSFASWEVRDYPYKCWLLKSDLTTEPSWWDFYVEKTNVAPISSAAPTVPPKPSSVSSRAPLIHTTLFPPFMPEFTPPAGAPSPPIPTDYPPRNPTGFCDVYTDGSYTLGDEPYEVEYDIECGTTIDYTGIMLTGSNVGFENCMYACRAYSTDCQAILIYPELNNCIILTDWSAQRYSTNESVALAIKGRLGSGLTKRGIYGKVA